MTYQEIVNRIQQAVDQHKMLADFGYGDLSDLKTRFENTSGDEQVQADYPYAFLNPTSHNRAQNSITYNFNLIVMDMARGEVSDDPYNNMLAIQSQCQQYIDDIIARLYYYYKDTPQVLWNNLTYTPFNERFQDDVAGMTVNLQIQVPNAIDECIAPYDPDEILINRIFVNVEECPAFDTAFRAGAPDYINYPEYTKQFNEFYAKFDEPGTFINCNRLETPLAINERYSTTVPYYNGADREWTIPAGVTGMFRFDFDLLMKNVQGLDLTGDQLRIQVIVNGQTSTFYDLPTLPTDGTVVSFNESFEIEGGISEDLIRILFRYTDGGVPAPAGPIVGYTGTSQISEVLI